MKNSKLTSRRMDTSTGTGTGAVLPQYRMPAGKRSLVQKRYGSAYASQRNMGGGSVVQTKTEPNAASEPAINTNLLDAAKAQHACRRNPYWTRKLGTTAADFGAPSLAVDSVEFAHHIAGRQQGVASLQIDGIAGPRTAQALSVASASSEVAALRAAPESVSTPVSIPVVVTATRLRVRSQPTSSNNGNIVGALEAGTRVEALGKEGGWLRIKLQGADAYIHASYTRPAESEPPHDAPDHRAADTNDTGSDTAGIDSADPLGLVFLFTWLTDTIRETLFGEDIGDQSEHHQRHGSGAKQEVEGETERKTPVDAHDALADEDLASLVASLDNLYVNDMAQDLASLQRRATDLWENRSAGEERGAGRDELVASIGAIRQKIVGLDGAGLDDHRRTQLTKLMYRAVHELAPFYAQNTNIDLLEGKAQAEELGTITRVTTRTCNITSLSMALESLGKSPSDYNGSQSKIRAVAKVFSSEVGSAKMKVGKGTAGLRMSDFMQLAAIAEELGSDTSAKAVTAAAVTVWEKILSIAYLKQLAARFDVSGSVKLFSTSADAGRSAKASQTAKLRNYGKKHRKITEKLVDARNKWEESGDAKDKQVYDKRKKEADAGLKGMGIEDDIGLEAYKDAVIEQIGAELDAGSAVVVLLSGHYVRLQAIESDHCVVDDPGRQSRSNRKVLWPEARAMGYFSYRLVLG